VIEAANEPRSARPLASLISFKAVLGDALKVSRDWSGSQHLDNRRITGQPAG
jgi:hypothetical protein